MQLYVGATLERPPAPRYYSSLSLIEIAPRGPLLKPGTMARWRNQVPTSARLSIVLPKEVWLTPRGAFRFDDESTYAWIDTLSATLRPTFLVLSTGAEFSPSARDRELFTRFSERAMRGGSRIVWQAGGVWEAEAAHALAATLGILACWDPLEDEQVSPGKSAYVRLRAIGSRLRLGEGLLLTVAERIIASGAEEALVAIESSASIKKARVFVTLLGGELAASDGEDDAVEEGEDDGEE